MLRSKTKKYGISGVAWRVLEGGGVLAGLSYLTNQTPTEVIPPELHGVVFAGLGLASAVSIGMDVIAGSWIDPE